MLKVGLVDEDSWRYATLLGLEKMCKKEDAETL